MKETVKVDTLHETPEPGDLFLLCSDGLSGMIDDARILEIVNGAPDLKTAVSNLIARANENGGVDNVSVILARWLGTSG